MKDLSSRRSGIRMRLLAAIFAVVTAGMTTTLLVAMTVGPPMIRRLMDRAVVPGLNGNHPYEQAFREATSWAVATALAVSTVATLTLSWYLSRRVHRVANALQEAASAVANGRYDLRVPPPQLGTEFDAVAEAFNLMAHQLGIVEETRTQMLTDLAHEIRTPISVLEAYMEAIDDGVSQLDARTVATLREQTGRLTRFSTDVTALMAAERRLMFVDPRRTSPADVIADALAAFQPRFTAHGVALRAECLGTVPDVWADPQRLAQVFGNLLDNALRHTPAGGAVTISATRQGSAVVVEVADTGSGVAPEHLPRLFDRFYRVEVARDRQRGGTGIGLSIAKALVETHNGHISAHSDGCGTGCSLRVSLPCMPA